MLSKSSKIIASALLAASVVGGAALSTQGQSQPQPGVPQSSPGIRPDGRPKGPNATQPIDRGIGWLFGPGKANGAAPSDAEWDQTRLLLSGMSPARWTVFEQVLVKPHRAERAKRFLFAKYSEMQELRQTNPQRYAAMVEQVKLEDEIFKLDSDAKQAQSPGEVDQFRARLREKVAGWVTKDFDEREARLKQLQERLDRERAALDAERAKSDEIVDRRVEVIHRTSDRFRAWAAGLPIDPVDQPFRRMKQGESVPAPLPSDSGVRRIGSETAPAAPRE